ncbi:DEAD/DEAH box helicase [Pedobacter sp. ASV1-7]|uniref:DEAD/DEAH box helicase n=1 Tax=Pedobacter sp. ASV1-7 TaxID=3145237 RepID=UPI0032E931AA
MLFKELNLIEPILNALQTEGYTQPTPIQEQSIPSILQGKDLLGCAQTGTGKTAAFAIPMLQLLSKPHTNTKVHKAIKALILTPTRELAIQIEESFKAYGRNLPLKRLVIFGGVGQKAQTDALQRGVDILVATPGRLLDLMNQGFINLKDIEIFVLDEADRMLDMGFIHDVKKVIAKLPLKRQTLFFSATMPKEIQSLANTILTNPVKVEVTPISSTAEKIQQQIFFVEKSDKRGLLMHILKDKAIETALVFARTKHGSDRIVKDLIKAGIKAEAIHGNKSQNARQRALTNFKAKTTRILVATDIAARGIDVDELAHVINYELPNIPETYVHRIGRTGRAGLSGTAFSFCDPEEKEFLDDIEKLIGLKIPVTEDHPYAMSWQSLMSGAAAAKGKGKTKPSRPARPERGPRTERTERQPNLSGAKKTPYGGRKWSKK